MNKTELVKAVAEKANVKTKETEQVVNAMFETITAALVNGEKVQIVGFGSFETKSRAARKGRNPQGGAEIEIPASKAAGFKAGKQLKDALNK